MNVVERRVEPLGADELSLAAKIATRAARVGVIGLGYVGLPLAAAAGGARFSVVGFDIDEAKVEALRAGRSYIDAVSGAALRRLVDAQRFRATSDFRELADCDVICICVPTPLTRQREPDLSYVEATARAIAKSLRRGQLIVLESTSYPGTTEDVVQPILEATGLRAGVDFHLAYSPEREDPGNAAHNTATIPKVVAGAGAVAGELVASFYGSVVERVVPVSSIKVAEAVKITENVFRAVNIALVNELKTVYAEMGIDIWEVIEAAKTKPFGYMPFYPGPGLGGHCIPVDPFYLTWKSREFEISTRFIELAGEINTAMPRYVVRRLEEALDRRQGLSLSRAAVLVIGVAYKKNVADMRESPALKVLELLHGRAADVVYHDPLVARIPPTREHPALAGKESVALTPETIAACNAAVIVTDHDVVDYQLLAAHSRLIVDTRNALARRGVASAAVVKA